MESIYYVICYLCHRTCAHCYEDRFRPYHGDKREQVVAQSLAVFPKVVEHLPTRMAFQDWNCADEAGKPRERRGRIILAGGEVLLDAVREPVLYPAIRGLRAKYADAGGIDIIVQTTGDIVTKRIVGELLDLGVRCISVAGLDAYHKGMETQDARDKLQKKLTAIFDERGMLPSPDHAWKMSDDPNSDQRYFHFFGATPDSWIGPLWPRGRAIQNEISVAGMADNFCNRWSGGLNFLDLENAGSEVSIEPDGSVYPCCLKTRLPLGNAAYEDVEVIVARHRGNPVYEAISMGHPERMGISYGWSVEEFLRKSRTTLPSGKSYANLCIGCDRFHEEVLATESSSLVSISGL